MTAAVVRRPSAPAIVAAEFARSPQPGSPADTGATATLAEPPVFAVAGALHGTDRGRAAASSALERFAGLRCDSLAAERFETAAAFARISETDAGGEPVSVCAALVAATHVEIYCGAGCMAFRVSGPHVVASASGSSLDRHGTSVAVPAHAGELHVLCNAAAVSATPPARIRSVLRSRSSPSSLARQLLAFAQSGDAGDAAVVVIRLGIRP